MKVQPWRGLAMVLVVGGILVAVAGASGWLDDTANNSIRDRLQYEIATAPPGAGATPVEVVEEGSNYRIVRHAAGTTRVPANPQRICALSSADELLSLGIVPVAHSIADGNFPDYLADAFANVPWIPNVYGGNLPNMEAIIDVHPDLIITRTPSRQTYEQLSKIAPVVVLMDHLVNYRQRVLDVGTIVGHRSEAEARLAWYNAKVDAARKVVEARIGRQSIAVLRVRPTSYRLYGDQNHVSPLLYGDLAVRRPRLVSERTWSASLTPEGLLQFDADYMILFADVTAGSDRTLADLLGHPIWQRVPAVRKKHVLVLNKYRHWADSGVLGRALAIDDVLRAVAPDAIEEVNAQANRVWIERRKGGV
jgi:iron complex transport system substrate-binding protein